MTVVDAAAFFDDLESIEELADRWGAGGLLVGHAANPPSHAQPCANATIHKHTSPPTSAPQRYGSDAVPEGDDRSLAQLLVEQARTQRCRVCAPARAPAV